MRKNEYPELTIEEIQQRWPDEWVLIEVTRVENYLGVFHFRGEKSRRLDDHPFVTTQPTL